ncbi:Granzyme B(G,H) [Larimichthys crocea]|uniref:trypsin n=1 Tax=Larimichthys crocea TaxID=215358 RepID=A0A6G0ISR6_LARCR|nr:Granzyme B(G,H) [Larimichthys crocea]
MHALHTLLLFHVLTYFGGNALVSEIINGKKTKQSSMMYMASVQDKGRRHVCGGFLISEDFVVTAAHCDDWKPTSVVLGTHNLKKVNDETMRFDVKRCKHPFYKEVASGNDIMLLKLSRKARRGKKTIKPLQLPGQDVKLKEGKKCKVAGWGFTRSHGEIVNDLQDVDVPIINLEKCQKAWRNKLPANVTCAGGYGTKKGFCQGDSGGPLVFKEKIAVGIVSFNSDSDCNYPTGVPNIYTDISKFVPWIKEILQKKTC